MSENTITPPRVWYRSLYWRTALGFIAFLAVLLLAQALLFVWLAGRTGGLFPATSNARLAEIIASDLREEIERDPGVNLVEHVAREYGRVVQPFVVVLPDGRGFGNREPPPGLVRSAQIEMVRMATGRQLRRPRRAGGPGGPGGPAFFSPIAVDNALFGLVAVPQGPPPVFGAMRTLGPTMAWSGLVLLCIGAAAAAALIFGPVRRRLGELAGAAERIGAGDVSARAPDHGGDEVAELAHSFNRMASDLQARAAALAASDRARRQLLADVSHELMTPLTAMRGYLETLAMPELTIDPPTRERYLRIVDEETRRLERIVGDLLDIARLEGGGSGLKMGDVSIPALYGRVAERHERELRERRVQIEVSVDSGAETVEGDSDRLEQAVQNLAANALRHTPDGGRLQLSASRHTLGDPGRSAPDDGSYIRLEIRDSGPGIAPEHLPLIFDRFYKADAARATAGSGLGLSIVRTIVEAHGGSIGVRNDGGAVFEILLPAFASSTLRRGEPVAPLALRRGEPVASSTLRRDESVAPLALPGDRGADESEGETPGHPGERPSAALSAADDSAAK